MGLNVHTNYSDEVENLIERFPSFDFLKYEDIPLYEDIQWDMSMDEFNLKDEIGYVLQIMFIGKTGYGKSTTLNAIVGTDAFETNDTISCTKKLYAADYLIDRNIPSFISFSDLPGVGESLEVDKKYLKWYKSMLKFSQVVVYVLRADQRDYVEDEKVFKRLFKNKVEKKKVILAINYADKIEPINRGEGLSDEQIDNLHRKVEEVANIFEVKKKNIVYYSAKDELYIDFLMDKIARKLEKNIRKMNMEWSYY